MLFANNVINNSWHFSWKFFANNFFHVNNLYCWQFYLWCISTFRVPWYRIIIVVFKKGSWNYSIWTQRKIKIIITTRTSSNCLCLYERINCQELRGNYNYIIQSKHCHISLQSCVHWAWNEHMLILMYSQLSDWTEECGSFQLFYSYLSNTGQIYAPSGWMVKGI